MCKTHMFMISKAYTHDVQGSHALGSPVWARLTHPHPSDGGIKCFNLSRKIWTVGEMVSENVGLHFLRPLAIHTKWFEHISRVACSLTLFDSYGRKTGRRDGRVSMLHI